MLIICSLFARLLLIICLLIAHYLLVYCSLFAKNLINVSFFTVGADCSQAIFANELLDLWNIGIELNGIRWRVAVVNGVWDGKGLEKVTFTQGSGALTGCNLCKFLGIRFAGASVYPFYSSYLDMNDPRRLRRPTGTGHDRIMYNISDCKLYPPVTITYEQYIADGESFLNSQIEYALHTEYFNYVQHVHGKMKRHSSLHAYINNIISTDVKMAAVKSKVCPHICSFIAHYLLVYCLIFALLLHVIACNIRCKEIESLVTLKISS